MKSRKSSIFIAILLFLLGIASFVVGIVCPVLSMTVSGVSAEETLLEMAYGLPHTELAELFNAIKSINLLKVANYGALFTLVGPLLAGIFALLFKNFRFTNILAMILIVISVTANLIGVNIFYLQTPTSDITSALVSPTGALHAISCIGLAMIPLSFVNLLKVR